MPSCYYLWFQNDSSEDELVLSSFQQNCRNRPMPGACRRFGGGSGPDGCAIAGEARASVAANRLPVREAVQLGRQPAPIFDSGTALRGEVNHVVRVGKGLPRGRSSPGAEQP